jgi:hypothetical protein
MRPLLPLALILCLTAPNTVVAAVRGGDAMYVGGTIAGLTEKTEGKLDLAETAAVFAAKKGAKVTIPYDKIQSLEYGQKAGRRVGLGIAISPLFLLSHKRRHFLTIGFVDEAGKQQGAVFELAKGMVQEALSVFETKSGKKVEYESEEARKHAGVH